MNINKNKKYKCKILFEAKNVSLYFMYSTMIIWRQHACMYFAINLLIMILEKS